MKTKVTINGVKYNLDLEKAKELGILEKEDLRCKSWNDFCKKYLYKYGYRENSNLAGPIYTQDQLTQDEALALSTFSKLLKLRRDWIGDWNPDWNISKIKYCITFLSDNLCISYWESYHHPFSFPTEKMAKEFLECFKELFEQCKYII